MLHCDARLREQDLLLSALLVQCRGKTALVGRASGLFNLVQIVPSRNGALLAALRSERHNIPDSFSLANDVQ